jgi:hypothetical protein
MVFELEVKVDVDSEGYFLIVGWLCLSMSISLVTSAIGAGMSDGIN